jgi:hypothetical protein
MGHALRNGLFYEENFTPKCKCFPIIRGDKCDMKSDEKKVSTISTTSIIALIFICRLYASAILSDILSFCPKRKMNRLRNRHYIDEKGIAKRFIYI